MRYDEDIVNRIKQINIENKIWIIYIGIIILSWYANIFEKNYFLYKNNLSKKKYKDITIIIFSILVLVYLYFLKGSIDDIKNLKPNDTKEKKDLVYLSFIGSLLVFTSGIIFLYIAINDKDINVEIAFN